jgi:CheY-like chemotaxis protein
LTEPKKVLVVDDEPFLRDLMIMVLSEKGYMVFSAENGVQGLVQFERERPDLVIADIVMPDMEGIELIRTLHKQNQELPIIVVSGNVLGSKFLDSARLFGARTTLKKPFSPEQLCDAVSGLIGGPAGSR